MEYFKKSQVNQANNALLPTIHLSVLELASETFLKVETQQRPFLNLPSR